LAIRNIPAPLTHPLVDKDGMITEQWVGWITGLSRLQKQHQSSIPDGVYKVGNGTIDGEITIVDGFITDIQEAT